MRLFSQYRGLRRENYILFFGRIVTNMGSMVWPMLTLIMNQKMGMSASTVAVVMVVAGLLLLPVNLLGGRLADRVNKKRVIVVCDAISVAFYILCGLVPLSRASIPLMFLAAACQSMEGPAYDALIADITATGDRERAYSLQYLGSNIGMVMAPTIAGFLFKNALWLAFIISGVSIGCSTLLITFRLKDIAPVREHSAAAEYQKTRDGARLWDILRENPAIFLFIAVSGLYYAAYQQFGYLMPLDLGRVHGEDGALIFGTVNSLNCLIVIVFTPVITALFARLVETKKALVGLLLQMAGFGLFAAMLGRVPFYYAAMFLFTWGEIFTTIAGGPYLSSRVPASHRGRINSLSGVATSATMSAGQLIAGRLYDGVGSSAAWTFVYGIELLAVALCAALIVIDRRRYPKLYEGR